MEHLLPVVRKTALLPAKERIAKLQGDFWVGYGRAEDAVNRLEDLLQRPRRIRMPNMLIIGPTNNGKTMIVEKFRRQHLPFGASGGGGRNDVVPVLMMQMPSDPTIKRFYSSLITALGSPSTSYSSVVRFENIAIKLLGVVQTKILIIDEIHNLLAGNSQKQREFLNVLRFIGNQLQLSIVAVGTRDAYLAIRSDDQLENRFEPFILPLWQDDHEFLKLLGSFQQILPLQKPSNLQDPDIRRLILTRSGGTIGEISTLLMGAACEAIDSGKEYIDKELLEQAQYRSPLERRRDSESMLQC